jgi:Domain of unknown function (DUF4126)
MNPPNQYHNRKSSEYSPVELGIINFESGMDSGKEPIPNSSFDIMLAVESLVLAGLGVGLASVAGVRAFVPLALCGMFALLGFIELPDILGLQVGWTLVLVLSALAVLEIVLDKVRALDPAFGYAMVPFKAVAGAVLFATMYGTGALLGAVPGLAAGAAIAVFVAVLGVVLRPRSGSSSAGVTTAFLSTMEDVVAVLGGILGIFLPFVPVLLVGFLLFFFHRIRKRRGRKYGGLRILGD